MKMQLVRGRFTVPVNERLRNSQHRVAKCGHIECHRCMRDCQLFKLMRSSSHCLHHLLPPVRSVSYSLRQRGHPYELLEHKYQKTKCSFIVRSIFDYL